ncbi:MAG: outer membrane lipoprotein-sorting protein [Acidobacteria bacterium]|nr:outer membrane lipoprotein-sorting protein [Acidobacteriota bacterium]
MLGSARTHRYRLFTVVVVASVLWMAAPGTASAQTDPRGILDRIDSLLRGDSSRAVATMQVVTEHWERQMTMEMWSLGTDYTLVRLRSPAKDAGTATLMAEDDIWNYLPKVDRSIKIPSSMMGGAWMGSHFTNDDLVQESQMRDVYDAEVTFEGERDGDQVWELRLTPKPEAAVVWGYLEFLVGQSDYVPRWAKYYDEDGALARTMEYSEVSEFGGRLVPAVMNMQPADKPGERTTIRYEDLEFDIDIDQSFFSLRSLQSGR